MCLIGRLVVIFDSNDIWHFTHSPLSLLTDYQEKINRANRKLIAGKLTTIEVSILSVSL